MLAHILKLFLATWRSLALIGTFVGLIYLWPDIRDLPKVYPDTLGPKWEFPMWLDREAIAFTLLVLAGIWILWIDIRPSVKQWWEKRTRPSHFLVHNNIFCEARTITADRKEEADALYEHIYYLIVENGSESGKSNRRVQARIHFADPPVICRIKDITDDAINSRHGEQVYFEIGRLVSKEIHGLMRGSTETEERYMKKYRHNVQNGHLSFEVGSVSKKIEYMLGNMKDVESQWYLYIVISADDVKAATVKISVKMTNTRADLTCERIN